MKRTLLKQKIILLGVLLGLLFTVGFFVVESKMNLVSRLDAISSNPNPFIRHFAPTWRSLKKIVDIPYLVVGAARREDSLPRYEIELTKNDLSNLLINLPRYPEENRLYESYKQGIKGTFRFDDYKTTDAKIRYRGVSPNHWNALKKSIQVNLPQENPLKERTTLRFFIGEDKGWVKGFLWNHLAEKLNLMSPKMEAVELLINKKPMGVYMLAEGWEESFLERYGRQQGRLFSNKNLPVTKPDLFLPESAFQWYDRFEEERPGETFTELGYFLWLIGSTPDDVFEKEIENILDVGIFLRWTLATVLSGNFHQGNAANLNFYFNPASGKFEPIFFDASPTKLGDAIEVKDHRVVNRLLKSERYRAQFETLAREYVSDPSNLANDLAFYDEMTKQILPAIYLDSAKIDTSFETTRKIRADREAYEHNFLTIKRMLEENKTLAFRYADETHSLSETAEHSPSFEAISASRSEFLAANPPFVAGQDADTIILLPGTYTFSRDVIVPKGLRAFIREGVHIFFGPSVSLISYSPVNAIGTFSQPISINSLFPNQPWGVFATINTNQKNTFGNVHLKGGKDATINGVYFSGMLSIHNGDLEFRSGSIQNAGADDGIHVLFGQAIIVDSLFRDNISDGIDIDFAKGESLFERNVFAATGGDAVDLSFSKITVRENTVRACGDKGVSVGEASTPLIENNTIKKCAYGIAVKDRSKAAITNNIFEENEIAIGLYRKKPHFMEGGEATISKNTFVNNQKKILADEHSHSIEIESR